MSTIKSSLTIKKYNITRQNMVWHDTMKNGGLILQWNVIEVTSNKGKRITILHVTFIDGWIQNWLLLSAKSLFAGLYLRKINLAYCKLVHETTDFK